MRQRNLIAAVVLLLSANWVLAAEPTQIYVPTQPMLMYASAIASGDRVNLRVQTIQYIAMVQEVKVKVPVTEKSWHKGKLVQQTKMVEQLQQRSYLQPIQGPVVDVPVDGRTVTVFESTGNLVAPTNLVQTLSKQTAVLVSTSGPVNPAYLQTSPPGTLIVQVPMSLLYPTVVAQSPAASIPAEPAAASAPAIVVNYNEPPLAPSTPKKN